MNKVTHRIDKLRNDRGWTVYKLSAESGVAQQTIHNWFSTETYPLIPAIENICKAFGITIADFFAEGNMVELTPDRKTLIDDFDSLDKSDQDSVRSIIKSLKSKK